MPRWHRAEAVRAAAAAAQVPAPRVQAQDRPPVRAAHPSQHPLLPGHRSSATRSTGVGPTPRTSTRRRAPAAPNRPRPRRRHRSQRPSHRRNGIGPGVAGAADRFRHASAAVGARRRSVVRSKGADAGKAMGRDNSRARAHLFRNWQAASWPHQSKSAQRLKRCSRLTRCDDRIGQRGRRNKI